MPEAVDMIDVHAPRPPFEDAGQTGKEASVGVVKAPEQGHLGGQRGVPLQGAVLCLRSSWRSSQAHAARMSSILSEEAGHGVLVAAWKDKPYQVKGLASSYTATARLMQGP